MIARGPKEWSSQHGTNLDPFIGGSHVVPADRDMVRRGIDAVGGPVPTMGTCRCLSPGATAPLVAYPRLLYPGLYLLGGLSPSAAYAVETSKGLVLVDVGLESTPVCSSRSYSSSNSTWKQIRAVLITHAHLDHTGGAEYMRVKTGAKIYAGQGDAGVLKAGGPHEAFFSAFSLPDGQLHPTTDRRRAERRRIDRLRRRPDSGPWPRRATRRGASVT